MATLEERLAKAQSGNLEGRLSEAQSGSMFGPGQFLGQLAGAVSTGDFSQFQNVGTQLRPLEAFGRSAVDEYLNNLIGTGDLMATTAMNSFPPLAVARNLSPQFNEMVKRAIPQIGDKVFPVNAGDILGAVQRGGEGLAALTTGNTGQFTQDPAAQQNDQLMSLQESNPVATSLGSTAGDVGALLTGRMPIRKGLQHLLTGGGKTVSHSRFFDERVAAAAKNIGKSLGQGVGKAAEAGAEGAFLALIDEGDPKKTAAFAAGAQGAGSLALSALSEVRKRPLGQAFFGLLLAHQIYKAIGPGDRNVFQASDESLNTIIAAYGLGITAAMMGAARVPEGAIRRKNVETLLDTATTGARGTVLSTIKDLARNSQEGTGNLDKVLGKLSQDPNYFGPSVLRRLENAAADGDLNGELDKLMENRSFRQKLDSIE